MWQLVLPIIEPNRLNVRLKFRVGTAIRPGAGSKLEWLVVHQDLNREAVFPHLPCQVKEAAVRDEKLKGDLRGEICRCWLSQIAWVQPIEQVDSLCVVTIVDKQA